MFASLAAGIVFGLSAGLSPGPLLALVISRTLKRGVSEGVKIALAVIAGKSRAWLERRGYVLTMRLLGVALFVFALILWRDGVRLLGWLH